MVPSLFHVLSFPPSYFSSPSKKKKLHSEEGLSENSSDSYSPVIAQVAGLTHHWLYHHHHCTAENVTNRCSHTHLRLLWHTLLWYWHQLSFHRTYFKHTHIQTPNKHKIFQQRNKMLSLPKKKKKSFSILHTLLNSTHWLCFSCVVFLPLVFALFQKNTLL